ncbi:F-box [Pyrenophora tritici-repentis]|nr:F-box [Pyrenophora tritici-repentis]
MSDTLEHTVTDPLLARPSNPRTNPQQIFLSHDTTNAQPSPRRSEVLRHVFPRPSRSRTHVRKISPRVTKADRSSVAIASKLQLRPRVAFHKYISSFFGTAHDRDIATISPEARSRASSFASRPGSSLCGSEPSLDMVSPATFFFSGPSLRSVGSYSDSMSRLPSLAETSSDIELFRRARTSSFSVLDDADVLEDAILEPGVDQGITRTVSDVLLSADTPTEEEKDSFLGEPEDGDPPTQDDTQGHGVYEDPRFLNHTTISPVITFAILLSPYLDKAEWKALRLTNRAWYLALSVAAPPRYPKAYHLPVEIVQHVYDYLSPKDFNAARHTCRAWMRASLDKKLLMTMLSRGGWLSSAENAVVSPPDSIIPRCEEWLLSCHLSRQCALTSGWSGNGLDTRAALVESSNIDFSELANGYASGLIFTTSLCSRYLCVARETVIYIYDIGNRLPVPVTSVLCPRRVLGMSMDVSSGRHAIAALLEGRMGLVCELRYGRFSDGSPVEVYVEDDGQQSGVTAKPSTETSHAGVSTEGVSFEKKGLLRDQYDRTYIQERDATTFDAIANMQLDSSGPPKIQSAKAETLPESCAHGIPIENETSTIYRHLCSEDDPPRSVAICPKRRCVAFGCSAGIELHWIDALTGQSLSRWFPLTAPSDYLYFLSPRPGFESAKKLRLISSAAHPEDRPVIRRKFFGLQAVSSLWGSFGFEAASRNPGSPNCDHYHAVPLSDGHHILFIDPVSGRLALGCDAPLGGPTKLLRKLMFISPDNNAVPRLYSAATDLSQGVRIVVTYEDSIMLYSVPPDMLRLSHEEQKTERSELSSVSSHSANERQRNHWLN